MMRQLLITAALASVAVTAVASLARMPASHAGDADALSSINPIALLQHLADDDDQKPDSGTDQSHKRAPTSIRADIDEQPASRLRSPTLLNSLAEDSPHRWSF